MFQRLYTIAANTFVETIRQPIYSVILLATGLLLVLNVSLAAFTLDDDDKLLLDLGLSTLLLSGLFLSAFSAAGVLSSEIDNKTVLVVLSKPITRPLFIIGKFVGLLAALLVAFYLSFLIFVLCQRHGVLQNTSDPWDAPALALGMGSICVALVGAGLCNFLYGKDFPTSAIAFLVPLLTVGLALVAKLDEHWNLIPFGSNFVGGQVVIAGYLVFLAVTITTAVALAASTRFGQVITLVICSAVLALGFAADYAFGQYEETSRLAAVAYRVVPNMGPFWVIDGLNAATQDTTVTFSYVVYVTSYALLITTGILGLAVAAFQRREVG